jgi:hypothetical protein
MLTEEQIAAYLEPLTAEQSEAIRAIRLRIAEHNPSLVEAIDEGKWFRGLLTYTMPDGTFVYALGPRAGGQTTFHMMPYYASAELQARHAAALKPLLTGKSCIQFARYSQVPEDALCDIIGSASKVMQAAMEMQAGRTREKKQD